MGQLAWPYLPCGAAPAYVYPVTTNAFGDPTPAQGFPCHCLLKLSYIPVSFIHTVPQHEAPPRTPLSLPVGTACAAGKASCCCVVLLFCCGMLVPVMNAIWNCASTKRHAAEMWRMQSIYFLFYICCPWDSTRGVKSNIHRLSFIVFGTQQEVQQQ